MAYDSKGRQYVRGMDKVLEVTPVLDTSAYASGDVLFPITKVSSAVPITDGPANSLTVMSVGVIDKDANGAALDLHFFSGSPSSFGAANGTVALTDADAAAYWLGRVSVGTADYSALGGAKVATVPLVGLLLQATAGTADLWMGGVISGTPTFTASGMKILLGVIQ